MVARMVKHIKKALELSQKLSLLADKGDLECDADCSAVLFGVLRDCAYKIRERAEAERSRYKILGKWDNAENKEKEELK